MGIGMVEREHKSKNSHPTFDGQREDEELLFIFRRHMISMRKGFYLLVLPLIITAIPPLIWQDNLELFLLPLIGLGVGLLIFAYHFILWYFSVYIVTNQRIRQVTQKGLFGRDVIDLKLSKIQSISYNIPGFSGDVFHFGTLVIHTYVGDLVIHHAEHPDKIYNKLQDAVDNFADSQEPNEEIS
jgi:hypothetical protein